METPKLNAERIKKYIEHEKRFDGRALDEFREIVVETGISKNAEGSARVKIGKTEVLVGVKMDVTTPYPDSPDKGNLMVGAELTPLSSPRFESGPPKFPAIETGRIIDRIVRESKFIEMEKLCIKEGEKVWNVMIDIYSLNDDGNLLDAAGIGAIAALSASKIPKYDEEKEKVLFGEWSNKNIPLSKEVPVSITLYKIGSKFIVDPSLEEEDISEAKITIGRKGDYISSMQKGDLKPLTIQEMHQAIEVSERVYNDVLKKIEKQLK
ncbi:exosome complex protein Rrp42 [Candidatus Pacearchaeota archaeon]|nr:exosome complex protein Rrp42 [Candidatus Pacearchaeota archaeon]